MDEKTSKVAIVTGGEKGIGLGIVSRLLKDNYCVAILGINEEASERTLLACDAGDRLAFFKTDVGNESEVKSSISNVLSKFGRIDGVVCNAGLAEAYGQNIETMELSEWDKVIKTNLTGIFLCSKYTFAELRKTRGAMVLIASTRAFQSQRDSVAYSASKGGVVALTHSLAISGGPEIRVNAISPGWIETQDGHEFREIYHQQHPVGRLGKVEDIAAMTAFLLSEEASFITGQNHVIDGGMMKKMIYEH